MQNTITLSDLEIKEFDGIQLSDQEHVALQKFRELRLRKLMKKVGNEPKFHCNFEFFRTISNTLDYREWQSNNYSLTNI